MSQDIKEQFAAARTQTILVIGLVLAAFYYFAMFDEGTRQQNQIKSLQQQIVKLDKDLKENESVVKDLPRFEEEVNAVSEKFQAALTYLPSKANMQEILKLLYAEGRKAGINLTKVSPKMERIKGEFYEEILVDVELTGSYKQITYFLSRISKVPRIINIKDVELKKSSAKDRQSILLDMKGTLVSYKYIETKDSEQVPNNGGPK